MTGWWQINGRGERTMHLHTEDDLYYINNYSLWLDIQILIRRGMGTRFDQLAGYEQVHNLVAEARRGVPEHHHL